MSTRGTSAVARPTMRNRTSIGIDFGTTNTVVAIAKPGEAVRAVTFRDDREQSDIYRSVLCFEQLAESWSEVEASAGMKAIRAYLTSAYETRFIQSFKSHVASAIFDETRIFGRGYKFEDLLSTFFRLRPRCCDPFADLGGRVVSGRPVPLSAPRRTRRSLSSLWRGLSADRYPRPCLCLRAGRRRLLLRAASQI